MTDDRITILPVHTFQQDLMERAWQSIPHPRYPVLATTHSKGVAIFSLKSLSQLSGISGGHNRSVRAAAWRPSFADEPLLLATGSFDSTVGLWRQDLRSREAYFNAADSSSEEEWEFVVVLEGHESEIKSVAFSACGKYLATSSRDKNILIWEDLSPGDDDWNIVAALEDHQGDVKAVSWCPTHKTDETDEDNWNSLSFPCIASASYDNTVRIWRQDADLDWGCAAVLEGHLGTVWGIQWEPRQLQGQHARLLSWSEDGTLRVWKLQDSVDSSTSLNSTAGMLSLGSATYVRQQERWICSEVLPVVHTADIYTAAWSDISGFIASAGSDGTIALYCHAGMKAASYLSQSPDENEKCNPWSLCGSVVNAHGPYQINHLTWCKRHDISPSNEETEFLVSTGDDGTVRAWKISATKSRLESIVKTDV